MQNADNLFQLPLRMYLSTYLGLSKYNQEIYNLIMDMFDSLPLACILNGKILCLHGGISH
jgi:diadenosine tetraphosphatase ApaH/serine/threonine PP2A family protein phosphatase